MKNITHLSLCKSVINLKRKPENLRPNSQIFIPRPLQLCCTLEYRNGKEKKEHPSLNLTTGRSELAELNGFFPVHLLGILEMFYGQIPDLRLCLTDMYLP